MLLLGNLFVAGLAGLALLFLIACAAALICAIIWTSICFVRELIEELWKN